MKTLVGGSGGISCKKTHTHKTKFKWTKNHLKSKTKLGPTGMGTYSGGHITAQQCKVLPALPPKPALGTLMDRKVPQFPPSQMPPVIADLSHMFGRAWEKCNANSCIQSKKDRFFLGVSSAN
jgi:hypothetical protein